MDTIELTHSLFSTEENFVVDNTEFEMEHYLVQTEAFLVENENIYGKFTDVQEGVLGDIWYVIKDIAKKAVQFVIWLWKSLVNFVKKVIRKIVNWLTGESDNKNNAVAVNHKEKIIKVFTIESARIQEFKVKDERELKVRILKEINKISREIQKRSQIQVKATKELEQMAIKAEKKAVQEGYVYTEEAKRMKGMPIDIQEIAKRELENASDFDSMELDSKEKQSIEIMKAVARGQAGKKAELLHGNLLSQVNAMHSEEYNKYIKSIDTEIVNGKNIMEAYNRLLNSESLEDILLKLSGKSSWEELLKFTKLTKKQVCENMIYDYHLNLDNPEEIKLMAKLRLNYNTKMVKILTEMVKIDYRLFGLNKHEIDLEIAKIHGGDLSALGNVTKKSMERYKIPGSENYDFRKIGGGVLFTTPHDLGLIDSDDKFRNLFELAMRWDAVVIAHGGLTSPWQTRMDTRTKSKEINDKYNIPGSEAFMKEMQSLRIDLINKYNSSIGEEPDRLRTRLIATTDTYFADFEREARQSDDPEVKRILAKIDNLWARHPEIKNATEKRDEELRKLYALDKEIGDSWNDDNKKKDAWNCQPIKTLNHGYSYSVYTIVDNLIDEGFKKIFICCCNPQGRQLPSHIMQRPGIIINYGDYSRVLL